MARPAKETVDYFPHDANASEGRTLTIIFNYFGHEGISCWWQLIERVSSTRNHVICIRNPEDVEYLAAKLHLTPDRLKPILNKLAELDAIDSSLYEHGFIWVQNFVERVAHVYHTRKQDLPSKPKLNGKETALLLEETGLITPISTQKIDIKDIKDIIDIIPDFIDKELFNDFLEMRKKKRTPNTSKALKLLTNKLTEFHNTGQDVNKIIENSIMNGWKGVFELNEKDRGNNKPGKLPTKYTEPDELRH